MEYRLCFVKTEYWVSVRVAPSFPPASRCSLNKPTMLPNTGANIDRSSTSTTSWPGSHRTLSSASEQYTGGQGSKSRCRRGRKGVATRGINTGLDTPKLQTRIHTAEQHATRAPQTGRRASRPGSACARRPARPQQAPRCSRPRARSPAAAAARRTPPSRPPRPRPSTPAPATPSPPAAGPAGTRSRRPSPARRRCRCRGAARARAAAGRGRMLLLMLW